MLEVVNSYLHGFVALPLIALCRQERVFSALEAGPVSARQLATSLAANSGYCRIVLRGLHALGWVASTDFETYELTEKYRDSAAVPGDILEAYELDYEAFLFRGEHVQRVSRWLALSGRGWDTADTELRALLDGSVMVPLLLELARRNPSHDADYLQTELLARIDARARGPLFEYLGAKGLTLPGQPDVLNASGRYLCERALTMAVTASYKPMLLQLRQLLRGDPARVLSRDADGHETFVDRTLNVIGSGFQHDRYFRDVTDLVLPLFDRNPVEQQPKYIVDVGCGDGALLKTLYTSIVARTSRGRHLDSVPLRMIGVDFNDEALRAAALTLRDIPHILIHGDISKPRELLDSLREHGVSDKDELLHVRSFLDHDRPIAARGSAVEAGVAGADSVYVDSGGRALTANEIAADLRTHLRNWAGVLGRHGLVLLEVFSLPVSLTQRYFSQTESFSFDLYHALSRQALVDAGVFHQALASAGLYPEQESLLRYPRTMPFSRIVLQHLTPRDYVVRAVQPADLDTLLEIERLCWPAALRLSAQDILTRRERFPDGQLVIEQGGRVAGVLYTQRFEDLGRLLKSKYAQYPSEHVAGGKYWQLLGIGIHPDFQSLSLGDRLLEHVLDLAALTSGVEAVYGVTRCLEFSRQSLPLAAYIQLQDEQGHYREPLLRFHQAHGATVEQVVPGARPEDTENAGSGVLIRYDLRNRLGGPRTSAALPTATHTITDVRSEVATAIRTVMRHPDSYAADRPLKELGLDSLNLMELRLLLNSRFAINFEPAFFFNYPTPEAIAGFVYTRTARQPSSGASRQTAAASAGHVPGPKVCSGDVAIVGMSLRFPGGIDTPEAYWELLRDGRSVITPRPATRWREYEQELQTLEPELSHINHGGFLPEVERFDAGFFHITPLEARSLDPQQRFLLELTWEALENAGIDPHALGGKAVGTFLGAYTHDYETLSLKERPLGGLDAYFGTGNALATAAGRLAYFYDFRGPTLTVDTACSSASTAVSCACRSLIEGTSEVALAGAVNMMLTPVLSVAFAKAGMLSVDGRCKTFDSGANGYVRSEGAAVLVLKRLANAVRDGDPIHAVIKATALMQDGRTNGLTAPNGNAQVDVIRHALAAAGCQAGDVTYVEAHGTGTLLGDPVEMQALHAAYCSDVDRGQPLLVGSVKTNLGHTEAVSGMAGLIKVVLAMQHRVIPGHLHLQKMNELLGLRDLSISIPRQLRPWTPPAGRPRLAGISSFGFSGSNTHIILEEFVAPRPAAPARDPQVPLPAVISGKSSGSLDRNIEALIAYLDDDAEEPIDVAALSRTLTMGRAQHAHRVAFSFSSLDDLRSRLKAALGRPAAQRRGEAPRIAFMFTGQGSQYHGMARRLLQSSDCFRQQMSRCNDLVRKHTDTDLFTILWGPDATRIDQTRYTQVALFCVEYSLALLLQSGGITPSIVLGHSVGEFTAACLAGVFELEPAIRLLCLRGGLMQDETAEGAMAAILASAADVAALVQGLDQVGIAARNGPRNQVVSGDPAQVREALRRAQSRGLVTALLPVSRGFHSPLMTPILGGFHAVARSFDYAAPTLTLISNVTGEVKQDALGARYWTDHIQLPVQFQRSVETLIGQGADIVVEVGPRPVLTNMAMAAVPGSTVQWLPTLLSKDAHGLAAVFATASQRAAEIRWQHYPHESDRVLPDLPRYRFERSPYWVEAPRPRLDRIVDCANDADLSGHVVAGECVFPAAGYVGLALEAGRELFGTQGRVGLASLSLERIVTLASSRDAASSRGARLRVAATPEDTRRCSLDFQASYAAEQTWTRAAQVFVEQVGAATSAPTGSVPVRAPGAKLMQGPEFYGALQPRGYSYAGRFRGVQTIWFTEGESVAEIDVGGDSRAEGYAIAPWVLDWCFQTALAALLTPSGAHADSNTLLVPTFIERVELFRPLTGRMQIHCRWRPSGTDITADLDMVGYDAAVCCRIRGLTFKKVLQASVAGKGTVTPATSFLAPVWQECETATTVAADLAGQWLILEDAGGYGAALGRCIEAAGGRSNRISLPQSTRDLAEGAVSRQWMIRLAEEFSAASAPVGLICCWPLALEADAVEAATLLNRTLHLLQFVATLPASKLTRILILTRDAQGVRPEDAVARENAASLWGLVSAFQTEVPHCTVTIVDVSRVDEDLGEQARRILQTRVGTDASNPFALRSGKVYTRHLVPFTPRRPVSIDREGCYVISGGLGGIGRLCAEFLHGEGAARIVLLTRSTNTVDPAWVVALNEVRGCIEVLACDVTESGDVAYVARHIGTEIPIKGIVHAAGVLEDAVLAKQTDTGMREVCSVKIAGADNLLQGIATTEVDFVWLFSSIVSLVGSAGQSNYAAANAALDSYAHHLRSRAIAATAINWGPWRDTGMVQRLKQVETFADRLRVGFLEPGESHAIFSALLAVDQPQICVARWRGDLIDQAQRLPAILASLRSAAQAGRLSLRDRFLRHFERAADAEYPHKMRLFIADRIAEITRLERSAILAAPVLSGLGMDSLMYVSLEDALAESIGREVSPTLMFDYPTLDELSAYVLLESGLSGPKLAGAGAQARSASTAHAAAAPGPVVDTDLDEIEALEGEELNALLGEAFVRD